MKKNIIAATILLISSNAFADVKVFISPPSWVISTYTTSEIEKYLTSIKNDQLFIKDEIKTTKTKRVINKYRELLKQKISTAIDKSNNKEIKKICKLSIATANTPLQDKSPPETLTLESEAENSSKFCSLFSKKIQYLLDTDPSLRYPDELKEQGLFAISMIFVFTNNN